MSRIVVGIDASEHAVRALRWALHQARLTGAEVELVYAFEGPDMGAYPGYRPTVNDEDVRQAVSQIIEDALERASDGDTQGVEVRRTIASGSPAAVLRDTAAGADLLVVGARGLGGFKGLVMGSVSHQVVGHAPCPVVVVAPEPR